MPLSLDLADGEQSGIWMLLKPGEMLKGRGMSEFTMPLQPGPWEAEGWQHFSVCYEPNGSGTRQEAVRLVTAQLSKPPHTREALQRPEKGSCRKVPLKSNAPELCHVSNFISAKVERTRKGFSGSVAAFCLSCVVFPSGIQLGKHLRPRAEPWESARQ